MNVLFYSRACPHCEGLFRTGLVSPTAVRLVCVDTTGVALPPEVHSVPALWLSAQRQLLVGPEVKKYFISSSSTDSAPSSELAVPSDPAGCSLGDGGCGTFSSIGEEGDASHFPFLSLSSAYGEPERPQQQQQQAPAALAQQPQQQQAAQRQLPPGIETRGASSRSDVSVDLDAFQSKRDAELNDILSRQKQPLT